MTSFMPAASGQPQQQLQASMYPAQTMPQQPGHLGPGQNGFSQSLPQQQQQQQQPMPLQQAMYQQQQPVAATVSFLDQQQQIIQENLQASTAATLIPVVDQAVSKASPAKKLTKKQLKKLEAGEELTAEDLTPKKKTPKQRKLQPKTSAKDAGLNNSVDSSSSQTELVNPEKQMDAEGSNSCSRLMPDSTQANIDATLDDLMKQYKLKGKKGKKGELSSDDESAGEEGDESTEQSPAKKGTKSRPKKPKKRTEDDSFDEFLAANAQEEDPALKKRRYSKKKGSGKADEPVEGVQVAAEVAVADDIVCHLKAPVLPMIVQKATSGRRKNLNLAKLMKKNGRKRKKKTSSGEEEEDEDDSDEGYEVAATKRGGKKASAAAEALATDEATLDTDAQNDENTAKALQVCYFEVLSALRMSKAFLRFFH